MVVMAPAAEGKEFPRPEKRTRGFAAGFGTRDAEEGVQGCCLGEGKSNHYYFLRCDGE